MEMSDVYQLPGLILTVLCHIVVAWYVNEQKYSPKVFAVISFFYAIIFVPMMGYGFAAGGWTTFASYIGIVVLLVVYFCIISKDTFPKKCFLLMTYTCLFSVLDNMLKLMIGLLLPQISEITGYYAAIVLRNIVILLVLILYKKYAAGILNSLMGSGKRWWNLMLIGLLFYMSQVVVTVLSAVNVMRDMYLLLTFAAISVIMCAVYGVIFSNINYMQKEAEAALIRQNTEYLSNRLSAMQNAVEANRRLRHDLRHHMEVIAEYAKIGDTSAILTYIGEYRIEISEATVKQYSLNRTVNSILSVYADKAEKGGLSFSVHCNVPEELKVRETDLIALLGNLLENALHGCRKSGREEAGIDIRIHWQNDMLIIVCNNSCLDGLKLSDGLPAEKSTGISSILFVCQKYDGSLDYRVEHGICSACAVLNLIPAKFV